MIDRASARRALLHAAGWGDADAAFLAGDASDRTYDRLTRGKTTAVLMDAPPGGADDPAVFAKVAGHLQQIGLSAPHLLAKDLSCGFLLLEDFGDAVFARVLAAKPELEPTLYAAAVEALAVLQAKPAMRDLPQLSASDWASAAALVLEEYRVAGTEAGCDVVPFNDCLSSLIAQEDITPQIMILRDFHAENLIWLPDRAGAARAGLLDFQLAQLGHPVYDVVSLLEDARRDVRRETAVQVRRQFCDLTGMMEARFDRSSVVWGAQRALRILGVFARLARKSGRTSYLKLVPRVWGHLQANLAHPHLADLRRICAPLLPAPSAAVLETLARNGRS
jgi:N-acetylmuramate 1-kinase